MIVETPEAYRAAGERWAVTDASLEELARLEAGIHWVDQYLNEVGQIDAIELMNVLLAVLECTPSRALAIIEEHLCENADGALGKLADRDMVYEFLFAAYQVLHRVKRSGPGVSQR